MVEQLSLILQNNVDVTPFYTFGLLVLSGLNLPISEDLLIIISGFLAAKYPQDLIQLFLGVYLGTFTGDAVCFVMGWKLGPKLLKINFFKKIFSKDRLKMADNYFKKYGLLTMMIGRFIPFGFRNAMYFSIGMSDHKFKRFVWMDLIACLFSNATLFFLSFSFGVSMLTYIKKMDTLILILIIATVIFLVIFNMITKRILKETTKLQKNKEV